MADGLDLFVDCLGFKILHHDGDLAVVERDGAKAYIVESAEFAAKDRPEVSIETDTIEQIYKEIAAKRPECLHPNCRTISLRPWGALEFAVLDNTGVCIVFRQWSRLLIAVAHNQVRGLCHTAAGFIRLATTAPRQAASPLQPHL